GPQVVDAAAPSYGDTFTFDFTEVAGVMEYSITGFDGATSYPVVSNVPYAAGEPVSVGGLTVVLDGQPADGDSIITGRAIDMEPDLFATLANAIRVLETPAATAPDKALLRNTLNSS